MSCDPCAHAPSASLAARCRLTASAPHSGCENGTQACAFVRDLNTSLGFHWDSRQSRGWGNFWSYLRTYHYTAALLGRRLLLSHDDHILPTDVLALDGTVSWRLPPGDTRQWHVVRDADVRAWGAAGHEGGLFGHLQSLAHAPHVWLNLSSTFAISKFKSVADRCGGPTALTYGFLWCIGRLFTTPTAPLAAQVRQLRARLPPFGYRALHIRTFGVDMHLPPEARAAADGERALQFYAWEILAYNCSTCKPRTLSPQLYAEDLRRRCGNGRAVGDGAGASDTSGGGGSGGGSSSGEGGGGKGGGGISTDGINSGGESGRARGVYVAADSRAAVRMVMAQCANSGNIVTLPPTLDATRAHTEARSYTSGVNRGVAQASSVREQVATETRLDPTPRPYPDPTAVLALSSAWACVRRVPCAVVAPCRCALHSPGVC